MDDCGAPGQSRANDRLDAQSIRHVFTDGLQLRQVAHEPMLGSGAKKRRTLTPARREQNRAAQKAYRQRQKADKAQKEPQVHSIRKTKASVTSPRVALPLVPLVSRPESNPHASELDGLSSNPPLPLGLDEIQRDSLTAGAAEAEPGINLSSESEQSDQAERDEQAEQVDESGFSAQTSIDPLLPLANSVTSGDVLDLLNPEELLSLSLPNAHANSIQFSLTTIWMAGMHNAACLGLDLAEIGKPTYMSPFYRPAAAAGTLEPASIVASATSACGDHVPPLLRPTLPQIMFPHHSCIDIVPLPQLRAQLVMLSVASDNETAADLKRDVYYSDGLVCWRSLGSGQPWDVRCWEAAPWFLEKWKAMVGGEDGDLWASSAWWRSARGESEG